MRRSEAMLEGKAVNASQVLNYYKQNVSQIFLKCKTTLQERQRARVVQERQRALQLRLIGRFIYEVEERSCLAEMIEALSLMHCRSTGLRTWLRRRLSMLLKLLTTLMVMICKEAMAGNHSLKSCICNSYKKLLEANTIMPKSFLSSINFLPIELELLVNCNIYPFKHAIDLGFNGNKYCWSN
ncbi:hypothetical protein SO802_010770 [Lithocarpus litseifolius]|uniref:Uncharacterized protein n=1 Tax=Lithocarpus litseifolius TaxID=425828 RepID=A0AAW2DHS0_9ROSI